RRCERHHFRFYDQLGSVPVRVAKRPSLPGEIHLGDFQLPVDELNSRSSTPSKRPSLGGGESRKKKRAIFFALCHDLGRNWWPSKILIGGGRFLLRKKSKRATIVFVDMEIMRTPTSLLGKLGASACGLFLAASSVFASDIVLQKVPLPTSVEAA